MKFVVNRQELVLFFLPCSCSYFALCRSQWRPSQCVEFISKRPDFFHFTNGFDSGGGLVDEVFFQTKINASDGSFFGILAVSDGGSACEAK